MKFPSPSLTPPALGLWEFYYNGYTFGGNTPSGALSLTGFGDNPDIRSNDPNRARDHGQLVGLDLYGGRTVTVHLFSQSNGTSLQSTLLDLAAALEVGLQTEQPLWFQQPNMPLLCTMCRARKKTVPWDIDYGAAMIGKPVAQLHATDPRVYGVGQAVSVGLPNPTVGAKFPLTFPISFGSTPPNGVTVVNGGNTSMRPVLVISGPVTNPSVVNASLPGTPTMTFSNPLQSGYTVDAGDQLVVDLDAESIEYYVGGVASGSVPASRMSWWVPGSTWWHLTAGSTGNLIQFLSADSAQVGGTCQIQWADAYIL